MRKLAFALAGLLALCGAAFAQNNSNSPGGASVNGAQNFCLNAAGLSVPCGPLAPLATASSGVPVGTTQVTASATGTTAATTATLPAVAAKTTFICGFDIGSTATAAAAGNATVTGVISGTLNFEMGTGTSPAVVHTTQTFNPCLPGSGLNTAIAVVSAAPGAGGVISVTAWGYNQ